MKAGGHNFHPSRISNQQKMLRQRDYEAFKKKKRKSEIKPIDLNKQNWSVDKSDS